MSAEPQHTDAETQNAVPGPLALSAVRERRRLRVVGKVEQAEDPAPARRPLSAAPAARPRRRVPKVVALLAGMMLALGLALLLNISISANQYDLVALRSQERDLTEQNQALSQEIEYAQAPQNLAVRASQLGMVSAVEQAQLDISNDSVSGTPEAVQPAPDDKKQAAQEGDLNLIDPPQGSDTEAAKTAQQRAKDQAVKDKAAQQKADEAKKAEEAKKSSQQAAAPGESSQSQPAQGQSSPSPSSQGTQQTGGGQDSGR